MSEHSKDNPDAHCLPLGLMQLHLHPQPRKIIQTPGVVAILYEAQGGARQIFTDGRCRRATFSPGGTAIPSAIGMATRSW